MKILLVEDDVKIASFIKKGFQEEGFSVDHVENGEDALHMAGILSYDTIVLDLMLPKLDGLSVIDQLRRNGINTPIIILSAKRSVQDRVKGFQRGSDDYLTKPFAFFGSPYKTMQVRKISYLQGIGTVMRYLQFSGEFVSPICIAGVLWLYFFYKFLVFIVNSYS
ncbi:response regulator [Desulfosarcina sp. BuS5]|uniref:response regulator n=1 Tax=Desulfosarcina sp. BuS5 TaxID=933262 RepID=UPI00068615C2|nr:response regulator [Desulfosarcina sp. BuS5]